MSNWRESSKSKGRPRAVRNDSAASAGSGRIGKAISLLVAAGLLGLLVSWYFDFLWPKQKTSFVFVNAVTSSEESEDKFLSSSAFSMESANSTQSASADFQSIDSVNALPLSPALVASATLNNVPLGPDQNVILFYLYANIFVDEKSAPFAHPLQTHREASTPTALADFLTEVCKHELRSPDAHRVVLLDGGRFDVTSYSDLPTEATSTAVQGVLDMLVANNVPNLDKLWVILAHDDFQTGWAAPELNGSVFAYFFSEGIAGRADRNVDDMVDLLELCQYVQKSVSEWVADYRDSHQTPQVFYAGGDEWKVDTALARSIPIVAQHQKFPAAPPGMTQRKNLDELWSKAYQLRQPHRQRKVVAFLTRLEQLNFSDSTEADELLKVTQALLSEAESFRKGPNWQSSSVFDGLSVEQLKKISGAAVVQDLRTYLSPPPAKAAAPDDGSEIEDASEAERPETPKPPAAAKPGKAILRLDGPERLAAAWHFLRHQVVSENSKWNHDRLQKLLGFVREADSGGLCADRLEMQYLNLLRDNLAWEKIDFDPSIFHGALTTFDDSQSLIHGHLRSYSGTDSTKRLYAVRANWRHVAATFDELEASRRHALDLAIAGRCGDAAQAFSTLIQDYEMLRGELRDLVEWRQTANELLFVLPYLKALSYRDEVFRKHDGEYTPYLSVADVALFQNAFRTAELLSLPSLASEQREELRQKATPLSNLVDATKRQIADRFGELFAPQSASSAVFETENFLHSPLPEWMRDVLPPNQGRSELREKYLSQLAAQQNNFLTALKSNNEETPPSADEAVESVATSAQETYAKLCFPPSRRPNRFLSLPDGAERFESWNQIRDSLNQFPSPRQLRNRPEDGGLLQNLDQVNAEIAYLEELDFQLRTACPSIGMSPSLLDVNPRQAALYELACGFQLVERSLADFWGSGVIMPSSGDPVFRMRMETAMRNLVTATKSVGALKFDDTKKPIYDVEPIAKIGRSVDQAGKQVWDQFRKFELTWSERKGETWNPLALTAADQIQLEAEPTELTIDGRLPESFSTSAAQHLGVSELLLGRKLAFAMSAASFDQIALDSAQNGELTGTLLFRGHRINVDRDVIRRAKHIPKSLTLILEPRPDAMVRPTITVSPVDAALVDVLFLFDCSESMRNNNKMGNMKAATIMALDVLVKKSRFCVGMSAFSRRATFAGEKLPAKDEKWVVDVIDDSPAHPFNDWELLMKIPSSISDDASLFRDSIDLLNPKGPTTPLYFSMKESLKNFPRNNHRKLLLVLSDGQNHQYPRVDVAKPGEPEEWEELSQLQDVRNATPVDDNGSLFTPTNLEDLAKAYAQNPVGKIDTIVIHMGKDNKIPKMPPSIKTVLARQNLRESLRDEIFDLVGRMEFGVAPREINPSLIPMDNPVNIREFDPTINYAIQTDPPLTQPYTLSLLGKEDLRFRFREDRQTGRRSLEFDSSRARAKIRQFFPTTQPLEIAEISHQVGILATTDKNLIRIGFGNERVMSVDPGRVWARVTDDQGKTYDVTRLTRDYDSLPVYSFRIPSSPDYQPQSISFSLFVAPEKTAPNNANVHTLRDTDSGTYRGLKYSVEAVSDSIYEIRIAPADADQGFPAFHLDCESSIPIDGRRVVRSIQFMDKKRVSESFQFKVPTGSAPEFNLHVALESNAPSTTADGVIDPIFGDEVFQRRFENIELSD